MQTFARDQGDRSPPFSFSLWWTAEMNSEAKASDYLLPNNEEEEK